MAYSLNLSGAIDALPWISPWPHLERQEATHARRSRLIPTGGRIAVATTHLHPGSIAPRPALVGSTRPHLDHLA